MYSDSNSIRPDFIVSSATGEKQLLVEVKKWLPMPMQSGQHAVISHQRERTGLSNCYYLLVTPERMTLWPPASAAQGNSIMRSATRQVRSAEVLANYLAIERYPLTALSEQELSLIVSSWLGSVIFKPAATLLSMPAQAWLVQSGVHEAIYRGYVRREQLAA